MKVLLLPRGEPDNVTIEYTRSKIFDEVTKLLPRSQTRAAWLPRRLGEQTFAGAIWMSHSGKWPDFCPDVSSCFFVASERCAALFREHAGDDVEIFPTKVQSPAKLRPRPPYFLVNIHRLVDCVNVSASVLKPAKNWPAPDVWVPSKAITINPKLIPRGVSCFVTKYLSDAFVCGKLAEALLAMRPRFAGLKTIATRTETEGKRTAAIAHALSIYAEATKHLPPKVAPTPVERLTIPDSLKAFHASGHDGIFRNVEVLDLERCATNHASLMNWKDLKWPETHVPIADDGRGGYFALDPTRMKDGDCPVVYFDHELASVDPKSGAITPNFEHCDDTFAGWLHRVRHGSTGLPRRTRAKGR
jgi:hypothetical protein